MNARIFVTAVSGVLLASALCTAKLILTRDVTDAGQSCYKVETDGGTFFLDKVGAGLTSLVDKNGNDWIKFGESGGTEWNGFPNAVWSGCCNNPRGYFHPKNGATSPSTTTVTTETSQKISISAISNDNEWALTYDFFSTHLTITFTKKSATGKYWVVYEGPPGGSFDLNSDWWMTSAADKKNLLSVQNTTDIPTKEWIAFGDAGSPRCLFLLNHKDDNLVDGYFPLSPFTVFGFGRSNNPYNATLNDVPHSFSIGFLETTDYQNVGVAMDNLLAGRAPTWGTSGAIKTPGSLPMASRIVRTEYYGLNGQQLEVRNGLIRSSASSILIVQHVDQQGIGHMRKLVSR